MSTTAKPKRSWLVPLVVAGIVAAAAGWLAASPRAESPAAYRTAAVERGDLAVRVSATGTVEPEEVVDVGAQVAGMIREFGPDPGDSRKVVDYGTVVEKGCVLARIDDAPYRAAVGRAKAQVGQAEAGVRQAEAQVEQAVANAERAEAEIAQLSARLGLAEQEFGRASRMRVGAALSAADHDTARTTYDTAKASVAVGRASHSQAKAAITDARANVAKSKAGLADARVGLETADINLGYCTVKSPVDGVIIDRRVNVGQTVVASLNAPSLFLIAKDLRRVQVWASVNEADIGRVRKGLRVEFRVDAYPDKTFTGEVSQVRLNAMMSQNVVTYTVVVTADNSGGLLLPYLTANVDIEADRRNGVLLVPNAALRWRPEDDQDAVADVKTGGTVYVEDGGRVRPVRVKVGLSDGTRTEVSGDDLPEGVRVVVGFAEQKAAGGASNPFVPQMRGKKTS